NDEWIRTRTGIEQRHLADDNETTADLAEQAARNAMDAAGVTADDIDFVAVGTNTPDQIFPNLACLLEARLGIHGAPAFGLEAACSGFLYAFSLSDTYIRAEKAKCALVIGAEALSKIVDWSDRTTCVLFGDGAGAVILKASDEPGVVSTHVHADGAYKDLLGMTAGVGGDFEKLRRGDAFIEMKGNEVFKVAVKTLSSAVTETLEANNLTNDDIDWLIPHQANTRILQAVAKQLDFPMDKVIVTVNKHGNTSAASVPLALDVAMRDGRIQPGQKVILEAFGGGFTWGSALVQF
ncbi:MAG: ketoacyl-ACP synthase III, partial [Gammaproteobacteria bacterium]|nr:ketoacyl-ACP synthase III [Gammaproteobacteria bacterium]